MPAPKDAIKILHSLKSKIKTHSLAKIYGPYPAILEKINNKYCYQLIIEADNQQNLQTILLNMRKLETNELNKVDIYINPYSMV